MMPEATVISAVVRNIAPVPLWIRRPERRRAPATDMVAAYAEVTNAARRMNAPREAMKMREGQTPERPGAVADDFGSYFEGHLAITPFGATWKPSGVRVPFSTTS